MGHDHSHDHGDAHAASEARLKWAALVTLAFMVAEALGGFYSGSLALLADAGHMLTDAGALGLAWAGFLIAKRPADPRRTYGFGRFRILAAYSNALTLGFIALWIFVEAVGRLMSPVEVLGPVMLGIAVTGLVVNIAVFAILHSAGSDDLNVRGALIHVAGDLAGSVAAIIAAGVIMTTGWMPIDPLLSMLVAALILRSAVKLGYQSGHILLEGAPKALDNREIATDLEQTIVEVADVHHVHAWSLTEDKPMVTLHARVHVAARDTDAVTLAIKTRLREKFGVDHATVEIECENCSDHAEEITRGAA